MSRNPRCPAPGTPSYVTDCRHRLLCPEPRASPLLLCHEPAEATLLDAMRSGRMHHAWPIIGPEGVGTATLAYRFARRLLTGTLTENSLALDPPTRSR